MKLRHVFENHGAKSSKELAGTTGLEPAASAVTGQQRDVTDWYQTVSADINWCDRVRDGIP